MKPGGCDITQQMIDEWNESIKGLFEDSTPSQMSNLDGADQGVVGGPLGEDAAEPGTIWLPHRVHKGSHQLHVKGMFGQHRPIAYGSRIEAERIAKKVGGTVANFKGKHHILRHGPLKEEYGAGFEGTKKLVDKYVKDTPGAVRTIKRVMRDKYKRKRKLI